MSQDYLEDSDFPKVACDHCGEIYFVMFESDHICSFTCPICIEAHPTMEDLDEHMWIHDQEEEKKASLELIARLQAEEESSGSNPPSDDDDNSCIVCLVEYRPDDSVRQLPCKHKFHSRCLSDWLAKKKECPLCSY